MLHSCLQTSYHLSDHSISPSFAPLPPFYASPPPDSLWVLQWNAGGLRARSTKLLHFLSFHPVDLICIQKSHLPDSLLGNLIAPTPGLAFSLLMPRTLATRLSLSSGRAYPILNFPPLSLLDHYSDYVGVNNSSVLFLNVYAPPPIRSFPTDGRTDSSLLQKSLHSGGLQLPSPLLGLKKYFWPPRGGSIQLGHFFWSPP